MRLRARIIYVDAAAKRVCLSLLPHLVAGHADAGLPPANTLYEVLNDALKTGFLSLPAGAARPSAQRLGYISSTAKACFHLTTCSAKSLCKLQKAGRLNLQCTSGRVLPCTCRRTP